MTDLEYSPRFGLYAALSTGKNSRGIYKIAADGIATKIVSRNGGSAFSIDASGKIYYEALDVYKNSVKRSNIYRVDPATSDPEEITIQGGSFEPHVLLDRIVFVQRTNPGYCLVIHSMTNAGISAVPDQTHCWDESHVPQRPRFSPDGKNVVFSIWRPGTRNDIGLWRIESDSISYAASTFDEVEPIFSADGREILFISSLNGHPELYSTTLDVINSDWKQLTHTIRGVFQFTQTNDELIVASPGKGGWTLYTVKNSIIEKSPVEIELVALEKEQALPSTEAVNLPYKKYRPARTALPTGWSPIFGIGLRDTDRYGVLLTGQDVVGYVNWDLQISLSRNKNPAADFRFQRHVNQIDIGSRTQFYPVSEVNVSSAEFVFRNELFLERPIIENARKQGLTPSIAIENRFRPSGLTRAQISLAYNLDSRSSYAWSIVPADGIALGTRIAGDSGFEQLDTPDIRTEISLQTGGFLFWKSQWQISALAAVHTVPNGPLKYTLRPPAEVASFSRRYISRAVPADGVSSVDRFGIWESEFILPLWYPQRGPGSIPLYFDYLATRWFISGSHWKNPDGVGQQVYAGSELELKLYFNWSFPFPPVRFGVRWPILENATTSPEYYLRVGTTFSE